MRAESTKLQMRRGGDETMAGEVIGAQPHPAGLAVLPGLERRTLAVWGPRPTPATLSPTALIGGCRVYPCLH